MISISISISPRRSQPLRPRRRAWRAFRCRRRTASFRRRAWPPPAAPGSTPRRLRRWTPNRRFPESSIALNVFDRVVGVPAGAGPPAHAVDLPRASGRVGERENLCKAVSDDAGHSYHEPYALVAYWLLRFLEFFLENTKKLNYVKEFGDYFFRRIWSMGVDLCYLCRAYSSGPPPTHFIKLKGILKKSITT